MPPCDRFVDCSMLAAGTSLAHSTLPFASLRGCGADEGVRPYTNSVGFAEDELSCGGAAFEVGLDQQG
jgi:hypothetical protein